MHTIKLPLNNLYY